jgi:hypothetical protein
VQHNSSQHTPHRAATPHTEQPIITQLAVHTEQQHHTLDKHPSHSCVMIAQVLQRLAQDQKQGQEGP